MLKLCEFIVTFHILCAHVSGRFAKLYAFLLNSVGTLL